MTVVAELRYQFCTKDVDSPPSCSCLDGFTQSTGRFLMCTFTPWSQRREAKAIVKNVTVQPIKPVYVTLVFAWNSLAGIL